jgi:hypothetical protein
MNNFLNQMCLDETMFEKANKSLKIVSDINMSFPHFSSNSQFPSILNNTIHNQQHAFSKRSLQSSKWSWKL